MLLELDCRAGDKVFVERDISGGRCPFCTELTQQKGSLLAYIASNIVVLIGKKKYIYSNVIAEQNISLYVSIFRERRPRISVTCETVSRFCSER